MFVSHGAPVLQPVEIYRGRPIFYSLGNFIFHVKSEKFPWRAREVWESVVGLCSFGEDGTLAGIAFHPLMIGGSEALTSDALERRLAPNWSTMATPSGSCIAFGISRRTSGQKSTYRMAWVF